MWKGYNIHSYSKDINDIIELDRIYYKNKFNKNVPEEIFLTTLKEIKQKYGTTEKKNICYSNLLCQYKNGWIRDPKISTVNFAHIFVVVWRIVQRKSRSSDDLYEHFSETLNDIGSTCVQGISHRLFMDYILLKNLQFC